MRRRWRRGRTVKRDRISLMGSVKIRISLMGLMGIWSSDTSSVAVGVVSRL